MKRNDNATNEIQPSEENYGASEVKIELKIMLQQFVKLLLSLRGFPLRFWLPCAVVLILRLLEFLWTRVYERIEERIEAISELLRQRDQDREEK